MEFAKKKVLVVGMGRSGLSAARWLSREGAEVTISDIKRVSELDQELLNESLELEVKLELGIHREETFLGSDAIVVSPGVPLHIAPLKAARERGISVIGEMELALGLVNIPIVAVTGTNGKSTSVTLLVAILEGSGSRVFMGGNIGTPLIDYAAKDQKADYAVVEVSSFQLDTMDRFCPEISLLLNISPDHLDRYPDYERYVQSKLKIFKRQTSGQYTILNDDDERLSQVRATGGATILRYGMEERDNRQAFIRGHTLFARLPGKETHCFSIERFRLPGRHNLENLMGVILACLALNLEPAVIQGVINDFKGLPHRNEPVGMIRGVVFYNDSKATNVDAASRSVACFERDVILLAGGRHKGSDYSPLVIASKGRVKKAILLGEARDLLAESFEGSIPYALAESMEDAVSQAFLSAESGDVVLLAPACSSFDMFQDYAQRGRVFRKAVKRLNNDG